jgi:hypothetical protein
VASRFKILRYLSGELVENLAIHHQKKGKKPNKTSKNTTKPAKRGGIARAKTTDPQILRETEADVPYNSVPQGV